MYKPLYLLVTFLMMVSCQEKGQNRKVFIASETTNKNLLNKEGTSIKTRFNPPNNYIRVKTLSGSFANYLQNFPLKPHQSKVHLYNGELKYRQDVHSAVLDIDVGKRDLQQCADATMRLRAEFLFKQKQFEKISFNFTNGFKAKYSTWQKGYRIKVNGNVVTWVKTAQFSSSYASFRKYLVMVFSYAGTLSLAKELPSKSLSQLEIGDIFIQGGSPGHAVIIVDLATNRQGDKVFLLAQSYMPAQEIHVLKNPKNSIVSPWYQTKKLDRLITPEWTFSKNHLKFFN